MAYEAAASPLSCLSLKDRHPPNQWISSLCSIRSLLHSKWGKERKKAISYNDCWVSVILAGLLLNIIPCRTRMSVPGWMSLNLLRNELQILFLFRCLASELEFRYPSSSMDLPIHDDEEYWPAETFEGNPEQGNLPVKAERGNKSRMEEVNWRGCDGHE